MGPLEQGCYIDGLFSNQKSQFGFILEVLRLENVDIFYVHLDYFKDIWGNFITIWYILCSFGTFFPLLVFRTNKNMATLLSRGNARLEKSDLFSFANCSNYPDSKSNLAKM
jgi:hypothetical protein